MEIMISRNSTVRTILFMLVVMAVLGGGYFAWQSGLLNSLFAQTQSGSAAPADEPAIQSLTALYAPSGDRVQWEEQVCAGMTAKTVGAQLSQAIDRRNLWWEPFHNGYASKIVGGSGCWAMRIGKFTRAAHRSTDSARVCRARTPRVFA